MTWAAPFSSGKEVTLATGEQFVISTDPDAGATAVACEPVRYEHLHQSLVPETERKSPGFTGYYLIIELKEIEHHCELLEENSLLRKDRIAGLLLGTAVGDSLGLPREGLSARRAARMFGPGVRQRFLLGRGMISDDTEHACMTAQALLAHPDDAEKFAMSLARRLRFWLLGVPAGIGFGTLRAILKLWLGFPPAKSGVRSAGNGPAMRSPIIGACFSRNTDKLKEFVHASTRLTHTDPRAEQGALAVALGAAYACNCSRSDFKPGNALVYIDENVASTEFSRLLDPVRKRLESEDTAEALASEMGLEKGVSGYVFHTVPVCLFCWLRYPDSYRKAVSSAILLGGDADTTGAITGALSGVTVGERGIPSDYSERLLEWPRSSSWIGRLAHHAAAQFPDEDSAADMGTAGLFWPGIPFRNLIFMLAVLTQGLRRLLPPY
jgi:ADP-ribosylglycohydrolase